MGCCVFGLTPSRSSSFVNIGHWSFGLLTVGPSELNYCTVPFSVFWFFFKGFSGPFSRCDIVVVRVMSCGPPVWTLSFSFPSLNHRSSRTVRAILGQGGFFHQPFFPPSFVSLPVRLSGVTRQVVRPALVLGFFTFFFCPLTTPFPGRLVQRIQVSDRKVSQRFPDAFFFG